LPFSIIRDDISKVHADAVVNAANTLLQCGSGVCGAIFHAAGVDLLQEECNKIGGCKVGEAVVTKGYGLPAKYVIHTVGPVWQGGDHGEEKLLYSCYSKSLECAKAKKLDSIAIPLISSGIYGYPKDQALRVAMSAISDFLVQNEMTVYLVVFDRTAVQLSERLFHSITQYIDDNYVRTHDRRRTERVLFDFESEYDGECIPEFKRILSNEMSAPCQYAKRNLKDIVGKVEESFSRMLLRLITEKGMTDVEVYKRANIDRKLFSKIRSDAEYKPSKLTAIALAIALRLSLDETRDLLGRAGFALSHSSRFDIIVEYFIHENNYDIYEINEALFAFDQVLLGA
jgi:O-acetyl-ADP-ribose deacetylase (regulator of RNase III)